MCDSWKKDSHDDLSLLEIATIFGQLPSMDIVRITGGEPFLRKDILDIVHLAQNKLKPHVIHITTNGFLTDRILQFCEMREKKAPLFMLLSLDGMKEKHNRTRGTKKAWDLALQTIKVLSSLRQKMKLRLLVNQTIVDEEGIEDYIRLKEYLSPYDIKINSVIAYDTSAMYTCRHEVNLAPVESGKFGTFGKFRPQHVEQLIRVLNQGLEKTPYFNRIAKRYYLRGIHERIVTGKSHPHPKCVALNSHLRIMPNGQIPICQFNTTTVGNFRHQTFDEIWFGEGMEKYRDWVNKCPGCWAECEVLPNAVYSGDILKYPLFRHRRMPKIT